MTHETLDRPSEQSDRLDTHSLRLDHVLQQVQGSQAFFDNNPQETIFTYYASQMQGETASPEKYHFRVTPEVVGRMRMMALGIYETLSAEGPLGHEIAQDIVESWKAPAHVVFEEARR